jgi:hypothetical protein
MIQPKIIYDPGTGAVTLTPTWPAKGKIPVDGMNATRTDSITSDGHRQTVVERIDAVNTLTFPYIPATDLAAWRTFLGFALAGGSFDYYPDNTSGTHTTYELSDQSWMPAFVTRDTFSMTLNLRKFVS